MCADALKKKKVTDTDTRRADQLDSLKVLMDSWYEREILHNDWQDLAKEAEDHLVSKFTSKQNATHERQELIKRYVNPDDSLKAKYKTLKTLADKDAFIDQVKADNPGWEDALYF